MKSIMANLWHAVRGVQIQDLGEKRRLGHSDSFCEAKMMLGVEIAEMGWDLSLRAQSQRAASMNSIWLREECAGKREGSWQDNRILGCRS
ncbi:hypothetical protein PVK06_011312 [Gossypium arboreum]|uniref:Uncharacterized protein n=1 Tax=Gossypium arboreum TaxID=29729 RepID=A0ABR0Q8K5_GOSAR|nr:hypothetical protein PVK06_011312 [Gossypium arboreum]